MDKVRTLGQEFRMPKPFQQSIWNTPPCQIKIELDLEKSGARSQPPSPTSRWWQAMARQGIQNNCIMSLTLNFAHNNDLFLDFRRIGPLCIRSILFKIIRDLNLSQTSSNYWVKGG
jgi:hypothetical protein